MGFEVFGSDRERFRKTGVFFDEVAAWMERDPIKNYRQRLIEAGVDTAKLDQIDSESMARVDEAEETARNSPPPPLDIAGTDVWADGSSTWRN